MKKELNYLSEQAGSLQQLKENRFKLVGALMSQQAKYQAKAEAEGMQSEIDTINSIIDYITRKELDI